MIPHFASPLELVLEAEDGGNGRPVWRLDAPLKYASIIHWGNRPIGVITVPAGFDTDLASVPRLPAAWLIAGGTANAAAVVHDWLYRRGKFDRATCDAVFAEAMAASGISLWRRALMWAAVRLGGWTGYQERPE